MPSTPKIVTRSNTTSTNTTENLGKGSKLTFAEMDSNFIELKNGSIGVVADDSATIDVKHGDTLYIQGGSNVTTSTDSAGVITIDSSADLGNLQVTDTTLKPITSNADLNLDPSGTGEVRTSGTMRVTGQFNCDSIRIDGENITSTVADSNVSIQPASGTGKIELDATIAVKDNTISTFVSNADLELSANGSGTVSINGLKFPTSDGSADQVLKTDGSGNLSFVAQSGGTTLSGSTNNTITTVTGASAIQGESNLTFDGSTLAVTGAQTITNTTTDDSLLITTTEDSSTAAPVLTFKRNSASPADADYLGQIKFKGENDADQEVVYAKLTGKISDASDTTEDGLIEFALRKAGSNNIGARLTSSDLKLLNGTGLTSNGNISSEGSITATTTIGNDAITINDNHILGTRSNENIDIITNGTGNINLDAQTIQVGDDDSAGPNVFYYDHTTFAPMITTPNQDDDLVFKVTSSTSDGEVGGDFVFYKGNQQRVRLALHGSGSTGGQAHIGYAGINGDTVISNGIKARNSVTGEFRDPGYYSSRITIHSGDGASVNYANIDITPLGSTGEINVANTSGSESKITNVKDPTSAQDAATKSYVDANAGATTGDITFVGSTIISPSNADLTLNPAGTGKVNINAVYTLPNADGSANQVLGTNGSGVLSFRDPTAINIDGGTADSVYTSVPTIDGGTA